ncbi:transposase [Prescottella equi]
MLAASGRLPDNQQFPAPSRPRERLAGTATAVPNSKSVPVESIRILRITRSTAVKACTQAMNALQSIIVTAPDALREELIALRARALITHCARLRPETSQLTSLTSTPDRMLVSTRKTASRHLAIRWHTLDTEIKRLTAAIGALVELAAPQLTALHGVCTEIASQPLITAGNNPKRLTSEAPFAKLCGVAPQPASSGRTTGRPAQPRW